MGSRNFRVYYEGRDIYPDVAVGRCWADGHAWGRLDRLVIDFGDTRNLWDAWGPKEGDEVAVEDGAARTGRMWVSSVTPRSSGFTVTAYSAPQSAREARSKSWERVRLSQLLAEAAGRHGLEVRTYGVEDREYAYVEQDGESDLSLLDRRLSYEGCGLIVYDGALVAYSGAWLEAQGASGELSVVPGSDYELRDDRARAYGACTVTDGSVTATYRAGDGRELVRVVRDRITDVAEAGRWARGLLRAANREAVTMTVRTDSMLRGYAAGSVVDLRASAAASWDGPAVVSAIRHDYRNESAKVWLTRPLDY